MDGYETMRMLGSGAYATVFLARRTSDGQLVALKRHMASIASPALHPAQASQTLTEARLLGSLKHPSIIPVLDAFLDSKGRLVLALEYEEGGSLSAALGQRHPAGLQEEEVWSLAAQLCSALRYAHRRAILHRDVTPHNILLKAPLAGGELP